MADDEGDHCHRRPCSKRRLMAMRWPWDRSTRDKDLNEEIESHLRMAAQDGLDRGKSRQEAQESARREFGNVGLVKEVTRDMWNGKVFEDISKDARYALRQFGRNPGFTTVALLTLALGIGATTSLFTVLDAVLLRSLPYPHPDQLVELMRHYPGADVWATNPTKFDFWRRENAVFSSVAAYSVAPAGLNLAGSGEPRRLAALPATSGFFRVFDVHPMLGRTFTRDEDRPGAGHYAVLSYGLWQQLFHGDPGAIGKTLTLSNAEYQVLGVMPAAFDTRTFLASQHIDLWVPLQLKIDPADVANDYCVIARLKSGTLLKQAQQNLNVVAQRFRSVYPNLIGPTESISIARYHDFLAGDAKRTLWILLAAVAFLLLLACANVANLLLAKAAVRRREMSVRVALGATGAQLIRQLLTESLLLSLSGGGLGCLIAAVLVPVLIRLTPTEMPLLAGIGMDSGVLLFTLSIAVLTGLAFGLLPALQSARLGIVNPLLEASRRTTMSATSSRLRHLLAIGEIAISIVLLIGASLLVKTMVNLASVAPGFDATNVLTMQMSLDDRLNSSQSVARMALEVTNRLKTIPGVQSVANVNMLPLVPYLDLPFEIIGRKPPTDNPLDELYRFASPDYFTTLKVPLKLGRSFSERDTAVSAPVLIVNEAFVQKYFSNENPLGQQIVIGRLMGPAFADRARQIVGVVGSLRDAGLGEPAPPEMFVPEAQVPDTLMQVDRQLTPLNWVIRTSENPMALTERICRETLVSSGGIPMAAPKLLSGIVAESVASQRFLMILLSIFAAIALLLGTIGLYGVISYSVAQRTREMGIRTALGARRADLLKLIVGEGMRIVTIGLVVGLIAASALTRFLRAILFGVSASDPTALATVTILLAFVALAACFIPAMRASRVNPVIALRED